MAGAAAVGATMLAVAQLKPKVRVVGDGTMFFEPVGLEEFSSG